MVVMARGVAWWHGPHGGCPQADVAQLAEQRFCKPQVAGSSPIVGSVPGGVAEWLMAPVCKTGSLTGFAGSNPAPTTDRRSVDR